MKTSKILMTLIACFFAGSILGQSFYPDGDAEMRTESEEMEQSELSSKILYLQKGNFMLGSGIGFSTSDSQVDIDNNDVNFNGDGGTSTLISVSPNIGYFFTNNFTVGVGMDYISSFSSGPVDITDPNSPENTTSNTDVLFGPFARIYVPMADDKAFFVTSTLGFGSSKDEFTSNNTTQTVNNNIVTLGVGPGFTVISKGGLALEAIVKYNYARSQSDIILEGVQRTSTTKTNAFDFTVGIQYYFAGFKGVNR